MVAPTLEKLVESCGRLFGHAWKCLKEGLVRRVHLIREV